MTNKQYTAISFLCFLLSIPGAIYGAAWQTFISGFTFGCLYSCLCGLYVDWRFEKQFEDFVKENDGNI